VLADHLLRGVLLEYLGGQVQRGEVADRADRPVDLPQRLRQRLALLLGQETGECALLGFERVGELDEQRRPLPQRCRRPRGERRLRGGHRLVQLGPIRPGRLRQDPSSRGIDHVKGAGALDESSIDQHSEFGHDILPVGGLPADGRQRVGLPRRVDWPWAALAARPRRASLLMRNGKREALLFLGGTYAVYAVLTRVRNCPGVTPTRRLK